MIIFKTRQVEEEYIEDILCNKCGKSLKQPAGCQNFCGLTEAVVRGNYDSPVLGDMTTNKFSLCEYCLKELFDSFVLPTDLYDYLEGCEATPVEFIPAGQENDDRVTVTDEDR
jgi:hypothetical protein